MRPFGESANRDAKTDASPKLAPKSGDFARLGGPILPI